MYTDNAEGEEKLAASFASSLLTLGTLNHKTSKKHSDFCCSSLSEKEAVYPVNALSLPAVKQTAWSVALMCSTALIYDVWLDFQNKAR